MKASTLAIPGEIERLVIRSGVGTSLAISTKAVSSFFSATLLDHVGLRDPALVADGLGDLDHDDVVAAVLTQDRAFEFGAVLQLEGVAEAPAMARSGRKRRSRWAFM
jgi:hypothetical protein